MNNDLMNKMVLNYNQTGESGSGILTIPPVSPLAYKNKRIREISIYEVTRYVVSNATNVRPGEVVIDYQEIVEWMDREGVILKKVPLNGRGHVYTKTNTGMYCFSINDLGSGAAIQSGSSFSLQVFKAHSTGRACCNNVYINVNVEVVAYDENGESVDLTDNRELYTGVCVDAIAQS